ncbi:hypothetical protein E4U22_002362 [Claviceps purpurea]|nr:hypothetical protein E4U28_006824 [Claviceps purpurea]KAG6185798.1 hypothetical protein E4U36_001139 [Claviceps purpurea]KAG6311837.1 hypothetical protein E4U22_002362 [Claviceps purpurea]
MGRKRPRSANTFDDIQHLPDTPPVLDPSAMHDQIEAHHRQEENRKASSSIQPLIPRFSSEPTTHGRYSQTPNQTEILGSLLPIESGEDHSTFATQQPDGNGEGSAIAESVREPAVSDDKWPPENTTEKVVHEPTEAQMRLALALGNANILQSQKEYKLFMDVFKQFKSLEDIRSLPDYDTLMSAASAAGHAPT